MTRVASRELRNQTRALLNRVADGEHITITVDGRPVAELAPIANRPQWFHRDEFARLILTHQADPDMAVVLTSLADESTDDLPLP